MRTAGMCEVPKSMIHYLEVELTRFRSAAKAVRYSPCGEDVHQLRISSRKLRTALRLLERNHAGYSTKKLRCSLKEWAYAAGRERDLEVAIKNARKFGVRLRRIRAKQKLAQGEIVRVARKKRFRKLPMRLDRVVRNLKNMPRIEISGWGEDIRDLRKWLTRPMRTGEDFHLLRIAVKRARYILEASGDPAGPLRALQDSLGKAHDLQILRELAGNHRRIVHAMEGFQRKSQAKLKPAIAYALRKVNVPH